MTMATVAVAVPTPARAPTVDDQPIPQNRIATPRAIPVKRLVFTYLRPADEGHGHGQPEVWRNITEWWHADAPQAEGGVPDYDTDEDGEWSPTGLVVTQRSVRCEDGVTFHPVLYLDLDGPPSGD